MVKFSESQLAEFNRLVARYPEGKQKSALLPVLHLAQDNFGGWLSSDHGLCCGAIKHYTYRSV